MTRSSHFRYTSDRAHTNLPTMLVVGIAAIGLVLALDYGGLIGAITFAVLFPVVGTATVVLRRKLGSKREAQA